jgi:hypothetical protein
MNSWKHMRRAGLTLAAAIGLLLGSTARGYAASEAVISGVESDMVSRICSDGGQWLQCYNKPPQQCTALAKAIVRPCLDEQLGHVQGPIRLEAALQYAVESKACFNRAVPDVLGPPLQTKDCIDMRPAHLW